MANREQGLRADLDERGLRLALDHADPPGGLQLDLVRYGCSAVTDTVGAKGTWRLDGPRAVRVRGDVTEWYENGPLGIEQGFDLAAPPACRRGGALGVAPAPVVLELRADGDVQAVADGEQAALFRDARGRTVLRYTDLFVQDADGRTLASWLDTTGAALRIYVRDEGARYPLHVDPLIWAQIGAPSQPADADAGDRFGAAVALAGTLAVVGAPGDDEFGPDAGAAYVFARSSGGAWVEKCKLLVGLATSGAQLGSAVAIAPAMGGKVRIVLGAPTDNTTGAVYWLSGDPSTTCDDTTLPLEYGLSGGMSGDLFGQAVAVSGDQVALGAPGARAGDGYAAVVAPLGGLWVESVSDYGPAGSGQQFGAAVSLTPTLFHVGAPAADVGMAAAAGAYYSYVRGGMGGWARIGGFAVGTAGGRLGYSLAAWDGSLLVGEPDAAGGAGAAHLFVHDTGTGALIADISPMGPVGLQAGDHYGTALSLHAGLAVVGAPGRAAAAGDAFVWELLAGTWVVRPAISRKTVRAGEQFGAAVAVDAMGRFAIIGAPGFVPPAGAGAFFDIQERAQNGTPCAADRDCASDLCIDGFCCNSACGRTGGFGSEPKNDCQSCAALDGAAADGLCGAARAGLVCRGAAGVCERDARCQAGNAACPANPKLTAGTVCDAAPGPCARDGVCDGLTAGCPGATLRSAGTVCAPALGTCAADGQCDGASDSCPGVQLLPRGTECRAPQTGLACDVAESCDGTSPQCPPDGVAAAGTPCRGVADDCDQPEVCTGVAAACPEDARQTDGVACAGGSCRFGQCRRECDVLVTTSAAPTPAMGLQPVVFTVAVQNRGLSDASGLLVRLSLSPGASWDGAVEGAWSCQTRAGGVLECGHADLAVGDSDVLRLSVVPPAGQDAFALTAVASSATFESTPADNVATLIVPNSGPLRGGLGGGGWGCSMLPQRRQPCDGDLLRGLVGVALAVALRVRVRRRMQKEFVSQPR